MESLRSYLNSLAPKDQAAYARRCGTTIGYLRKALSIGQQIGEGLAICLEKESDGVVRCEGIRPDVDWGFIRGTRKHDGKAA